MAKYLFKVSFSVEGLRGVMKEGAANRAAFIGKLYENAGGQLESFNFAFGDTDLYSIGELPDDASAAAIAMAVASSGVGSIETVKLLTPDQVDAARGIDTGYRAPGA